MPIIKNISTILSIATLRYCVFSFEWR